MAAGKTSLATTLGFWTPTKISKNRSSEALRSSLAVNPSQCSRHPIWSWRNFTLYLPGLRVWIAGFRLCAYDDLHAPHRTMIIEIFTKSFIIRDTSTSKMWSPTPCNTYCFQIFAGQRPRICSSLTADEPVPSHHGGSSQPGAKRSDGWRKVLSKPCSKHWVQHDGFISNIAKPWHILLYETPPAMAAVA